MNKTVVRTVFATLCVEAVIALIAVLWITGGEFGPMIRKADSDRRASQLFGQYLSEIPVPSYILRGGGPPLPANSKYGKYKEFDDWKLEFGPYKEWSALKYGNKKNITGGKSEHWSYSEPNWKLELGPYKEWSSRKNGNKKNVKDWKSEHWSYSEDTGWKKLCD